MRFSLLNPDAERREGLKALIRQIDRHARFSEAHDWRQADRALRRTPPDLLVIDWEDSMSLADLRKLVAQHPSLAIAVLTDEASLSWVRALVDEGMLGIIPRGTNPDLIVRALEIVVLGGHYVPACALHTSKDKERSTDVTVRPFNPVNPGPKRVRPVITLSPRQEQIMRCVHMGSTNKMIARTLGISEGTVKIHLTSIFQQLGAPNWGHPIARRRSPFTTAGWLRSSRCCAAARLQNPGPGMVNMVWCRCDAAAPRRSSTHCRRRASPRPCQWPPNRRFRSASLVRPTIHPRPKLPDG